MTRVREMLERSRRSLLDGTARQRLEGSTRQLWEKSRATVAQLVNPGSAAAPTGSQDVLAGVCSSVALRDLNLVDLLLEQLEKMEAEEDDPEALARLYKLDHLATRLRRNGENLRVLAGRDAGSGSDQTSSLVDVVRAGMSSIEHYTRVELGKVTNLGVVGFAADDVSRLLAELLDNATSHSPPSTPVKVSAHLTERGSVLIRIEDSGIGLPAARLSALNERLGSAPVLDRNAVQHMGLAVVRRLSKKHGINVWLARRAPHGTVASVVLPSSLVEDEPDKKTRPGTPAQPAREPKPTPSDFTANTTVSPSAPRRVTVSGGLDPQGSVDGVTEAPTTRSGLPRRVPQSLKDSSGAGKLVAPEPRSEEELRDEHEKLLSDLDAFAEGEQAAQSEPTSTDTPDSGEGHDR